MLHEAVILGNQDIVLLLLDRGAKVEGQIISGFLCGGTALHLAVTESLVDIAGSLLNHGANADKLRLRLVGLQWTLPWLDHQTTVLEALLTQSRHDCGSWSSF